MSGRCLTDKTFVLNLEFGSTSLTMLTENVLLQDVVEKQLWMFGDEIQALQ
jgi:hypothetical protein